jgi:aspartyl-tRNA(Asn)/glutamyl-tRNA(Gln) amidotransferase subunit A
MLAGRRRKRMNGAAPMTARAIAAAVRDGLDAAAPVAAALAQVERLNPALNAMCHVMTDIDAQITRLRACLAAGDNLPLAGVPVVVKDNIWVRDAPVTQGSQLFRDFVAPQDALAVARLRAAGAVILGIGTCSEFACKGVTTTPLHGVTRHPADPALTPGGSSGGPAVAVASGMAPVSLGTDAGGSSRRPPAHVGIVGFKPGQDVIPYGPGFSEPFYGLSVLAPMATDVEDARLMLTTLADGPLPPARPLAALRIGYAPAMGLPLPLDGAVAQALGRAIDCLRSLGLNVSETTLDWPADTDPAAVMPIQMAGLAHLHGARWRSDPDLFDPDLGAQIEAGLALSGADVARALEASARMRTSLRDAFRSFDLILSATSSALAWPYERLGPASIGGAPAAPRDHAAFTPQYNHAGLPAISIPCGAPTGLPVGLQIGAGPGQDMTLLGAAAHFETLFLQAGLWPAQTGI